MNLLIVDSICLITNQLIYGKNISIKHVVKVANIRY